MQFAQNTQHDTSKVLRLPRRMTMEVSKVLLLARKLRLIFWKWGKILYLSPKTIFDTFEDTWERMSWSATPATQNNITTCFDTFEKERFCGALLLPPQTRRGHKKTRDSRRDTWEHQNEHFVRDNFDTL